MTGVNGHSNDGYPGTGVHQKPAVDEIGGPATTSVVAPGSLPEPVTRAKQRAKQQIQQNRFVIIAAGAVVTALLIFAVASMPHRGKPRIVKNQGAAGPDRASSESNDMGNDQSLFPIIDSGRPAAKEKHQGFLTEQDLQRTITRKASQAGPTNAPGSLASIVPFGEDAWQAPPYHPGSGTDTLDSDKKEREATERSSLIYVRSVSTSTHNPQTLNGTLPELDLGLATGTRLRARLESAVSTAVRTPVLAVIEYNYERNGEIVVPAGAKAVGHIRDANRSGYVDIQFESLLMPDGASFPITAAATDLDLRPLKGKVEGKNTGKNILVRSLSGIGEAASMLVGQGSLNQPFSQSDIIRERVSSNIGEAGDQQVARLAATQHIVVTVSAGVSIYVVLQQTSTPTQASPHSEARNISLSTAPDTEQLRQLLQLQQDLSQPPSNSSVH